MKRIKIFTFLLVICFCLPGCSSNTDYWEKQQTLKEQGMELQASGNYEGAIASYEKALNLSDMKVTATEIDLAYYKASAQYQSGDLQGAIDTYTAILAMEDSAEAYFGRGILYVKAREAQKASEDLTKALKKNNSSLMEGIIYQAAGDLEKAKECFEKAKKEGEQDAVLFLADLYEKAGDSNYAEILIEESVSEGKASAENYLNIAAHYIAKGAYEKALSAVQSGIALGESGVYKELLREEIICYEKLGDFANAKVKAEAYVSAYPKDEAMTKEYEFLKSR